MFSLSVHPVKGFRCTERIRRRLLFLTSLHAPFYRLGSVWPINQPVSPVLLAESEVQLLWVGIKLFYVFVLCVNSDSGKNKAIKWTNKKGPD